jgi:hypothetical protein
VVNMFTSRMNHTNLTLLQYSIVLILVPGSVVQVVCGAASVITLCEKHKNNNCNRQI